MHLRKTLLVGMFLCFTALLVFVIRKETGWHRVRIDNGIEVLALDYNQIQRLDFTDQAISLSILKNQITDSCFVVLITSRYDNEKYQTLCDSSGSKILKNFSSIRANNFNILDSGKYPFEMGTITIKTFSQEGPIVWTLKADQTKSTMIANNGIESFTISLKTKTIDELYHLYNKLNVTK